MAPFPLLQAVSAASVGIVTRSGSSGGTNRCATGRTRSATDKSAFASTSQAADSGTASATNQATIYRASTRAIRVSAPEQEKATRQNKEGLSHNLPPCLFKQERVLSKLVAR
jgi:hypothetical protein